MTRIQLRRDTATNWATNNPIPSAGEPCFEVDTGKLKIGDGSTAYNDLAYQGGGGSGGGAEIDDTTTSTSKVWSSSKTNSEIQSVADEVTSTQSDLTDLKTTVNGNTSDILTLKTSVAEKQPKLVAGDNITIDESTNVISATGSSTPDNMVTTNTAQTIKGLKTLTNDLNLNQWTTGASTIRETHIDLSGGEKNNFISADGSDKHFGLYSNSSQGIQIGTSKTDFTQGLTVSPTALTFKDSDGNVTDLLAGGSGDVTAAGDNTFTGTNTFKAATTFNKTITCARVNASGVISEGGIGASTLYFGLPTIGTVPNAVTSETNKNVLFTGYSFDGSTAIKYSWDFVGTGLKYGTTSSSVYDVVTKSPDNNTYMAHMAMPSGTYVDLTLGASGATYTAPADGFYMLKLPSTSEQGTYMDANLKLDGILIGTDTYIISFVGDTCSIFMPAPKNAILQIGYNLTFGEGAVFRFIYANGSEPST